MSVAEIYYNRMFGWRGINYELSTETNKTEYGNVKTRYFATFGLDKLEVDENEYKCLLEELQKKG